VKKTPLEPLNRRDLILGATSAVSLAVMPLHGQSNKPSLPFADLREAPTQISAFAGLDSARTLTRSGREWRSGGLVVTLESVQSGIAVMVAAPSLAVTHLRLRWQIPQPQDMVVLGDAWERSYGDLGWRNVVAERPLPWYCAVHQDETTHCYGVLTGAASLAMWQVDAAGITLWLDVRNGGEGVVLGARVLKAATLVARRGERSESIHGSLSAFCRSLCPSPRLPKSVVYGSNDWYYAYGRNTAGGILRDAELVASLAPASGPKPLAIVDDGWQDKRAFPDMEALTAQIRSRGARPGLWIRPMRAQQDSNRKLLLPEARFGNRKERFGDLAYDPTIPEARQIALDTMREAVRLGNDLVKHDYSTYELFGAWGSEMGPSITTGGWHFNDRSQTNAEIVLSLYRGLRDAAGEQTVIIGCNTIGHLAAGVFEANRTGDDVSGRTWERTRRMGVNTLAFRLPQNRTFFIVDADCVPLTKSIEWEKTRMWLDVVARSGTALIISPEPGALDNRQKEAVREAFAHAAATPAAVADDALLANTPHHWSFQQGGNVTRATYAWDDDGASPFAI
jgi:alpha-galactosidase